MGRTKHVIVFAALAAALLARPASAAAPVDAAHWIRVEDEHLRVTSRWYGYDPVTERRFATPLPPGTRFVGRGVTALLDADGEAVVGVGFDEAPGFPLELELELPAAADAELVPLPLPLDAGWQRIEVEGEHRLVPDPSAGAPMHTSGYFAPGDFHVRDRLRVDRGMDGRHPGGAAYLPGEALIEAGGVPARLESGLARRRGLGIAAGAVFVSGLIVLVVVVRRQAGAVAAEDAEAFLAREFDTIADAPPRAEPGSAR
jgi:hypothetical protein